MQRNPSQTNVFMQRLADMLNLLLCAVCSENVLHGALALAGGVALLWALLGMPLLLLGLATSSAPVACLVGLGVAIGLRVHELQRQADAAEPPSPSADAITSLLLVPEAVLRWSCLAPAHATCWAHGGACLMVGSLPSPATVRALSAREGTVEVYNLCAYWRGFEALLSESGVGQIRLPRTRVCGRGGIRTGGIRTHGAATLPRLTPRLCESSRRERACCEIPPQHALADCFPTRSRCADAPDVADRLVKAMLGGGGGGTAAALNTDADASANAGANAGVKSPAGVTKRTVFLHCEAGDHAAAVCAAFLAAVEQAAIVSSAMVSRTMVSSAIVSSAIVNSRPLRRLLPPSNGQRWPSVHPHLYRWRRRQRRRRRRRWRRRQRWRWRACAICLAESSPSPPHGRSP